VLVRPSAQIPVFRFDGVNMPYADKSFDAVLFVDVLHHAAKPLVLLEQAKRLSNCVLIKDHFRRGPLAAPRLRLMDWVGNAHQGVSLPYNYWSKSEWLTAFRSVGLKPIETRESLGLYPPPASWLFERGLHFIARFEVPSP
jgi:SAM-dependent methyltransferase